jgi:hypothetical protein
MELQGAVVGLAFCWTVGQLVAACGSSDDRNSGGVTASAGGSSMGGALTAGASGSPSIGGSGGSTGFAQCGSHTPDSQCTQAATCAQTACGAQMSQLDTNGCVRPNCRADTDCAASELCFPGPVANQLDARFAPTCVLQADSTCKCTGKDARSGAGAYCVERALALGDWGCTWNTRITGNCADFSAWIAAAETLLSTLTLYSTVQTGAAACITRAQQDYAAACP